MDISDIEAAIVSTLLNALTASPSLPGAVVTSSINGTPQILVGRGWPSNDELQSNLDNSVTRISVFPVPGMTRILPTRLREWKQLTANTPSIMLTTVGQVVTLSGTTGPGQVCGIAYTPPYSPRVGYSYRVQGSDTLSSVATALASSIAGASSNGPVVTLPPAYTGVQGGSVADQTSVQELRHQTQDVLVTIWAPNPVLRDSVSSAVDLTLAEVDSLIVDGIVARPLTYRSGKTVDTNEAQQLWRRDLTYSITYPTVQTQVQPSILFPWLEIGAANVIGEVGVRISGPSGPVVVPPYSGDDELLLLIL